MKKTTTDAVTVEIKSYGNVPYVTTKTDSNNAIVTDLAALTNTSNAWYGYVKGKTAYTESSNVNEVEGVVSIVDGGTQTSAYYVLPTAVTTDTIITGKITPKTQKNSWTLLQLVDTDGAEFIGLRTKSNVSNSDTDMEAIIRTDGTAEGSIKKVISKDTEYDFTINYAASNGLTEIILQATGGTELKLPAQKFTNTKGIKAVKIFGNGSDVSIKDVAITPVTSSEATGISIAEGDALELEVGDETSLTAIVEPIFADASSLAWSSSAEGVATVADGKVTAVAAGTANITATLGAKTATIAVTVKEKLDKVSYFTSTSAVSYEGTKEGTFFDFVKDADNNDITFTGAGTGDTGYPKIATHSGLKGVMWQTDSNSKPEGTWLTVTFKVKATAAGKLKNLSYKTVSGQTADFKTEVTYKIGTAAAVKLGEKTPNTKGDVLNVSFDFTNVSVAENDEIEFTITNSRTSGTGQVKTCIQDIVLSGKAD